MKTPAFLSLVGVTTAAGVILLAVQSQRLAHLRAQNRPPLPAAIRTPSPSSSPSTNTAPPPARSAPSTEVLALRAEVTRLRMDLENASRTNPALPSPGNSDASPAEAWGAIHAETEPGRAPGFVAVTNLAHRGFATPSDTLETFHWAFHHQAKLPLDRTRMKELWDVPDDFDHPDARYSIDIGDGLGSHRGYRVVAIDSPRPGETRVVLEYERAKGGTFHQERTLVLRDGRWRLRPRAVTRFEPAPPTPAVVADPDGLGRIIRD